MLAATGKVPAEHTYAVKSLANRIISKVATGDRGGALPMLQNEVPRVSNAIDESVSIEPPGSHRG